MKKARAESGWYRSKDKECDDSCHAAQYLSLGILSNMGASGCDTKWRICDPLEFRGRDIELYRMIVQNRLPQWKPDGEYRHSTEC